MIYCINQRPCNYLAGGRGDSILLWNANKKTKHLGRNPDPGLTEPPWPPLLYWKVCSPPEGVGEGDEGQRDDVVHHHDGRVFPPRVHVHRGVDGVAVEAALDQVGDGDVRGHRHATLPVWKAGNERRDDRT